MTQTGSTTWIVIGWIALAIGFASAGAIAWDIFVAGYRQQMAIMNAVWPITALYFGPVAVWFYFRRGRHNSHRWAREHGDAGDDAPGWWSTALGVSHCGAGCTLGDIVGEWLVYLTAWTIPIFAAHAANSLMAMFVADFVLAWTFGIVFPVLLDRPDARRRRARGRHLAGDQGGHAVDRRVPGRPVRLHGALPPRVLAAAAERGEPGLLVHDADRDDRRLLHRLAGQRLADPTRDQGEDVMPTPLRRLARGIGAGAVGTALINLSTYLDMALRGRPPSSVPQQDVQRLADRANISLGDDEASADARRSALGSLTGYATGFGIGAAYGVLEPSARRLPAVARATVVGLGAMAVTDGASAALGTTDPRTWSPQAWAADVVPHLAYGFGVVIAYDAFGPS
jgi:hypothetical protein